MEKSNLDSKKSSKQHEFNEGFSGKNINPSSQEFKTEFETDAEGITTEVERARYSNTEMDIPKAVPLVDYPTKSINQTPEKAEHKDFNSNPDPNQFPDKTKQNQENRGNIEN